MGSRAYDFLTDSFLFDSSVLSEEYRSVDDKEIQAELARYREFCLTNVPELKGEITEDPSSLKIFSGIRRVDIELLKQSAFYVHQHVLYDPLFELTQAKSEQSDTFAKFLGLGNSGFKQSETCRYR